MRQRFCRHCSEWHEIDNWPHNCMPEAAPGMSSRLPVPQFISDTMDPTEHVDGKHYTSKSEYRKVTKARGYIELGNDPARLRKPKKPTPDRQAINNSVKAAMEIVASQS